MSHKSQGSGVGNTGQCSTKYFFPQRLAQLMSFSGREAMRGSSVLTVQTLSAQLLLRNGGSFFLFLVAWYVTWQGGTERRAVCPHPPAGAHAEKVVCSAACLVSYTYLRLLLEEGESRMIPPAAIVAPGLWFIFQLLETGVATHSCHLGSWRIRCWHSPSTPLHITTLCPEQALLLSSRRKET